MHAVVRTYSGKGAKGLIDVIEKNKTEVGRSPTSNQRFCQLLPSPHHARRVLSVRLRGQGRHRREHSGGTGLDQ